jgi:hypothetical protein
MLASALVVVGATVTALAGDDDLLDALLQRPAAATGTTIVPGHHLRRWDPITIFHGSRQDTPGPEDTPSDHVRLEPEHPGAWTWLDDRTLQFRPAEPWSPATVVSVRTQGARADLFTLHPPPIRTVPRAGRTTSGPVDRIELVFADPVPPDALARLSTIEVRPLPGLTDDGLVVLGADDFEVKTLERAAAGDPVTYALILDTPIDRGAAVRVKVGLSLDTTAEEAVYTLPFSTPAPFRPVQLGCSGTQMPITAQGTQYPAEQPLTCSSDRRVELVFNASLADLDAVAARNLIRFEPAVDDVVYTVSDRRLQVRGAFRDDQLYRVSVHPTEVRDVVGRPVQLEGESAVHVVFPRKTPYVKWGAGQGILERYGPRRVPLEGRGIETVDLRVHRIDPLNRELWPFPTTPVRIDEDQRPPGPGEEPPPLGETSTVDSAGLKRRLASLGTPGFSDLVSVPLTGATGRGGLDLDGPLTTLSGARRPGHYLVGLREVDGASDRRWMRVQVTDLALTTLETEDEVTFLVTSLSTGRPVANASVALEGVTQVSGRQRWQTRHEARTGGDGQMRWKAPGTGSGDVRRIVVTAGDDVLVLDATKPPEVFADGHWKQERSRWFDWAFRDLDRRRPRARKLGHLFAERPVYRPEEDVFLKGFVRTRERGRLAVLGGKGRVDIQGPGADWSLPVTLSANGSWDLRWSEDALPTGTYQATYVHSDGTRLGTTDFQVEAYRLPTFELDLETAGNRQLVPNDTAFEVQATAAYYAGGNVANRPIQWSVTQFPYPWNPDGPEGFVYSSDGRYARVRRFDSTPAQSRQDSTDAKGHATLVLDPSIEPNAQPRTYVIEATVTDADQQTVTATHRIDAVPAFVLGLKAPRYQERANRLTVEAIAVGPQGDLLAGTDVTVRLIQRQWHSVLQASDFSDGVARYVTDVVDEPVATEQIQTTTAPRPVGFDLPGPGVYIVELEARDALGRVQVVTTDLFAGGKGDVSWSKPEQGVFDLVSDAPSYVPGDTAKLVLQSPWSTATALVVVETPSGNRYQTVPVSGGRAVVSVPVEKGWVPKIPVHVLLRRGRNPDAGTLGGTDLGKPATVATTHWLVVEPAENTVAVELSHPERAMPGETIPVTVELSDPAGKPLAGEVTLWLVDQAVLALGREKTLDPRPAFIRPMRSRFEARTTRNLAFGRLPFHEMPGGDGEEAEDDAEGLLDRTSVRQDFESVPYYAPALQVPASGRLTVQVALPDNLTVFKLRAKATSGAERFGVAKSSLRVRLPVLLQPDLPRFVRPGDRLSVGALARVVEGDGGAGAAQIAVEGLALDGSATRAFRWDADESVRIGWPVTVPTPEASGSEVKVTIGGERTADGASDAVAITLPVRDDRRDRTERAILEIAAGRTVELPALAEEARRGTLDRQVVVSDHPGLVRMAGGLDLFLQRPARSMGQQLDRARAWLGLGGLRSALGMVAQPAVDQAVAEALAFVGNAVDGRGLVAEWPGGTGHVTLTADALEFLVDAEEAGHRVDPQLRGRLVATLERALRSDYGHFIDGASWRERTRALQALARANAFSEPYYTELGSNRRYLDPNGKAGLLLAATSAGRADGRLAQDLVASLKADVVVGLYEGQERYQGLKSAGGVTSAFIPAGEAYTVASVTRGLLAAQPTDPTTELLVDALVRLGGEDGWGGRADAPALLALAERLGSRPAATVAVTVGSNTLTTREGVGSLALDTSGAVPIRHTAGPDAIVYARSTYSPAKSGARADAVREGFVVSRTARRVTGEQAGTRTALDEGGRELTLALGDVVEDHVQVVTPEDHAFVAITVPFAAGLEPLNPALRTAPAEATPSATDTRRATWRDLRDDAVTYYFEQLPKGTYDFRVRTRATTAGRFVQPPAVAELVFEPAVNGTSPGAWVGVE